MKKMLLIASLVMFLAAGASAIPPPIGYIGIYKDATHYDYSPICPPLYGQFHAWIWCMPGEHGLIGAEFAVGFPATTSVVSYVRNPSIVVELGSLAAGISVAFGEGLCQRDWVYLYDITLILLSSDDAWIIIMPHPGTWPLPAYQFATCEMGYPIEPCIYLTPLYLCTTWAVEETSWGAIKSPF